MNIFIADDHAVVRAGLIQLLGEEFPLAQFTEASDGVDAYKNIIGKVWDLILLDISMPGSNGLEILKQLKAEKIKAPILILSIYPEEQYAIRAFKAGASGFLNKGSATKELIAAVHKILSGRKYISASVAEKLAEGAGTDPNKPLYELLSDREMQVLQFMANGKAASDIADELHLSVQTISTYRTRILEKLDLTNNAELTRYALDNKLV